MSITSFRSADLNDVAALVQLVNTVYHPASGIGSWTDESRFGLGARISEQSIKNLLVEDDSIVPLGLHEDAIIACVHLKKSANRALIGMLAFNPACQCTGIGKQMLA